MSTAVEGPAQPPPPKKQPKAESEADPEPDAESATDLPVAAAVSGDAAVRAEHCENMGPPECYDRALEIYEEEGGPQRDAIALALVRSLCIDGASGGCAMLGHWSYLADQDEDALAAFLEACRLGNQKSCALAGEYLVGGERDGVQGDVDRGLELLKDSCLAKSCYGCVALLSIAQGFAPLEPDPELEAFATKHAEALPSCLP